MVNMKMNVLLLAVASVMSSVLSTQATFTVSLELQGGECSHQLTLICRHSETRMAPLWIHNGTLESGEVLGTAFPGAVYTIQTRTEHTATITGVDSVRALDGHVIQCVYENLGKLIKSNAVKFSFIPPDFQPKLKRTDVVQSFSQRFCTLTYELEDYAEGIAKYHRCANQFSVNFTVAPNANMSSIFTNAVAQCNITNLERCKVYDILARFYRGDQVLDTVYDVGSVMTSPGQFTITSVSIGADGNLINVTYMENEPDCPGYPTERFTVDVYGVQVADLTADAVQSLAINHTNGSVTLSLPLNQPLPENAVTLNMTKYNTVPANRSDVTGNIVTEMVTWNATAGLVFNPHPPPPTMAGTTIPSNAADLAVMADVVVAIVSAAVLVACVVVCCIVLCVCMTCCRRRKSTQGNYTIGRPPRTVRMNSYEAVRHEVVFGRGEEEHVVDAEVGASNIQEAFPVREIVSSDESQGITDPVQENDKSLRSEEKGRSASALQRGDLKQFHNADHACVDGDRMYTFEESAAVYEIHDEQSFNEPLSEEEQGMPDTVIMVVGRTEKVVVSERRPNLTLEEDTLSMSSSTSLQDPRDVIAEMSVKSVVVNQVHSRDNDRENELDVQDGGKASAPSNSPPKSGDNATVATKEAVVEFYEDSSKTGTESLPPTSVAVTELEHGTLSEIPLGKAQVDNDKECAGTITKPSGNVRVGLQPSHYADIDFSKKGPIPAPRNEMYNVVYAEIKK